MKITMNETRKGIMNVLKSTNEPMTLSEIATAMGRDKIATGTTNAMLTAGLIRKVGTKKVAKVTYVEVNTYEIGDVDANDVGVDVK